MHSSSPHPSVLTEDLALAVPEAEQLAHQALDRLSRNRGIMKSRKVKLALVEHPQRPAHLRPHGGSGTCSLSIS